MTGDEAEDAAMDTDDDLPRYLAMLRQVARCVVCLCVEARGRVSHTISRRTRIRVPVWVDDLCDFFARDDEGLAMVDKLVANAMRFVELFSEVIDALIKERFQADVLFDTQSTDDVYLMHRTTAGVANNADIIYPAPLLRRYELHFVPRADSEPIGLRRIRAEHIGSLLKTRGIVVRASELMPQVTVAVYLCDKCGHEVYQPVTTKNFMPLFECQSVKCKSKKESAGSLHMQTRGSKVCVCVW